MVISERILRYSNLNNYCPHCMTFWRKTYCTNVFRYTNSNELITHCTKSCSASNHAFHSIKVREKCRPFARNSEEPTVSIEQIRSIRFTAASEVAKLRFVTSCLHCGVRCIRGEGKPREPKVTRTGAAPRASFKRNLPSFSPYTKSLYTSWSNLKVNSSLRDVKSISPYGSVKSSNKALKRPFFCSGIFIYPPR